MIEKLYKLKLVMYSDNIDEIVGEPIVYILAFTSYDARVKVFQNYKIENQRIMNVLYIKELNGYIPYAPDIFSNNVIIEKFGHKS